MTHSGLQGTTDIIVLAGGSAARMGSLCAGIPKALLPVMGIPFMVWQALEMARASGDIRRVLYSVRDGEAPLFRDVFGQISLPAHAVAEESPLGTGGAILKILAQKEILQLSDPFLVLNGDVLFAMQPDELLAQAVKYGAAVQGMHVPDATRFGRLSVAGDQLMSFSEKTTEAGTGLINAGLYAFRHAALAEFPNVACSFENDIAPALAKAGQCGVVQGAGSFIDIGTPQAYAGAEDFVRHFGYEILATARA